MDKNLHDKLISDITDLRNLLGQYSTETIVGTVATKFLRWPSKDVELTSPHRQLFYLLGLMLTSPEPSKPQEYDESAWSKTVELLERIFSSYAWMFWPTPEEAGNLSKEWKDIREVAMPAFLNYFNSGLLASTEQVKNRFTRYIVPFDNVVNKLFFLSAIDLLNIADFIGAKIQEDFDSLSNLIKKEERARLDILDEAEREKWDFQTTQNKVLNSSYADIAKELFSKLRQVSTITISDLQENFGSEKANVFIQKFATRRGSISNLTYPTDLHPEMETTLYYIDDNILMIPSAHSIYLSILEQTERSLLKSDVRDKFLPHRDQMLEDEAAEVIQRFFREDVTIWRSVFETPKQQFEHDIIFLWNKKLFVVEAKATPPREPLRDPERAFIRIRDDFQSDRGIQKAYDQAKRIEEIYEETNFVCLYDRHGRQICEIKSEDIDKIYSICVTRDNFGLLATDLSLLLNKKTDAPFPLAINILDLDTLLDAFSYFKWTPDRLCEYLDGREKMHGRVTADDEMEYAGYLIAHGTFDYLFNEIYDRMFLNPGYSVVFDQIFYAKHGGKPVNYNPKPPVTTDLSAEMKKWMLHDTRNTAVDNRPIRAVKKQGRNEPCACGSGKKFKKCCGRS